MPFVMKDKQTDNNANQPGQNISGTSTSFGTNLPGQTANKGPQKSSGQYQNIQNYLQANQPQAQQMAQQVSGNVEKQIGEAQTKTAALPSAVQKTTAYDPSKTLQNLGQASDAEKAAYQTTKQSGGYTGPQDITGLSGYGDAYTAAEKAKEQYGLAGTESGQQTLLAQTYNRPNYTQGASALDQSLMQRNEQGRQTLLDLQNKYKGLADTLSNPITQAQNQIAASRAQAQTNLGAFQPAETQAREAIINPLQTRVAQTNAQQETLRNNLQSDLTDLKLTPETLQMLGLATGQRTYGTDLSKYINPAVGQATMQNLANQSELDKYNQLMNFLGTNTQELASQAIGYQGLSVNKDQLAKDIATKQAEFDNYWNNGGVGNYGAYYANVNTNSDKSLGTPFQNYTPAQLQQVLNSTSSEGQLSNATNGFMTNNNTYLSDASRGWINDYLNSVKNNFNYNNIIEGA